MKYGSVCSGIEAATKPCAKCGERKTLEHFHRQPGGPLGRHSYCKVCENTRRRKRTADPQKRRNQNYKTRYGLSTKKVQAMLTQQGGKCDICKSVPTRPVVDHNHKTGAVRSVLCHSCNIKLPTVEDRAFLRAAQDYLRRHA